MTMDDNNVKLSLAGIWSALSAPVMALAEELALRRASVEHPAMELRIRSGAVDAMRLSGGNREVLLTAAGRPQLALKDVIQQLPAGIGPDVFLASPSEIGFRRLAGASVKDAPTGSAGHDAIRRSVLA